MRFESPVDFCVSFLTKSRVVASYCLRLFYTRTQPKEVRQRFIFNVAAILGRAAYGKVGRRRLRNSTNIRNYTIWRIDNYFAANFRAMC